MINLPVIDSLDEISPQDLSLFKEVGFCFVRLKPSYFETLARFTEASKQFFRQAEAVKLEHAFDEGLGGYMTNIDEQGSYVERYSYRDAVLPEIIGDKAEYSELKTYLQQEVAETFLRALFTKEGYGQYFDEVIADVHAPMSFVYYPEQGPQQESVGLAPHKDLGLVTLLYINQKGLEISVADQWHAVAPRPGYILINAGRCLELMTGGDYQAIWHRVRASELEGKERVSVPLFLGPNPEIPLMNYKTGEKLYPNYLEMAKVYLDKFFPLDKNKPR